MGGAACAAVIIDTGNKANQIKALCDGALLDLANGDWGSRLNAVEFEQRINLLLTTVQDCLSEAQDIAADYA